MAVTYLDLIQSEECPDRKKDLRSKFQSFILNSNLIRPKYLLSRIEGLQGDDDLCQEKATIYGKVYTLIYYFYYLWNTGLITGFSKSVLRF